MEAGKIEKISLQKINRVVCSIVPSLLYAAHRSCIILLPIARAIRRTFLPESESTTGVDSPLRQWKWLENKCSDAICVFLYLAGEWGVKH